MKKKYVNLLCVVLVLLQDLLPLEFALFCLAIPDDKQRYGENLVKFYNRTERVYKSRKHDASFKLISTIEGMSYPLIKAFHWVDSILFQLKLYTVYVYMNKCGQNYNPELIFIVYIQILSFF